MDIKLRARLSAYSKVESIDRLINTVSNKEIDSLFNDTTEDSVVSKDDIDNLFNDTVDNTTEDNTNSEAISKDDIDGLFNY